MTEALKIIGDISRVRMHPGDVVIVKVADHLTRERALILRERVQKVFPGHEVVVLDGGMDLQVARPAP